MKANADFKDSELKTFLHYLKNFGFKNEVEVVMPGKNNAKMHRNAGNMAV